MAKTVTVLFGWALFLMVIVFVGVSFFAYQPTFPYADELLSQYKNRLITTWAQFDGVHYLTIIKRGYDGTDLIQAFFPLYPLLVTLFSFKILNEIAVGVVVSFVSLVLAIYYLHQLIVMDETESTAKRSMALLLLFPTSFFLLSLYTESLFLALVVTSFYAARKNKWWLAGLLGFFAGITRVVGVVMLPALIYEFWLQHKKLSAKTLWCLGPLLGLMAYMAYLWIAFGDPLLFYHVQAAFGGSRTSSQIVLLPQVFFRYFKMLLTTQFSNPIYPIIVQEIIAGLLGLLGLLGGWFSIRKSYIVFGIGAYLLPTLTGTFSSMPRYLLPIFPLFIVAAKYLPKKYFILVLVLSTGLLLYNLIRFTQGLWVA